MATPPKRTDIDFEEFRQLLLAEQSRLTSVQRHLQADRAEVNAEVTDQINSDSAEFADTANAIYSHDVEEALEAEEKELLRQIEDALERIEDGTYGICTVTGDPIPVERLRALPWATMTVEAAERVGL
jgi:RNA polymerase-binding protein DksA